MWLQLQVFIHVGNSARIGDSLIFKLSNLKQSIDRNKTVFNDDNKIVVDSKY